MKKILKKLNQSGFFWNMMGSGMLSANTILMTMTVSHTASLDTVGVFTIALTTSQLLYVIALFGVNDYQMTDFKKEYTFQDYFCAKLFSSIVTVFCCALFIVLFGFRGEKAEYTAWLTLYMIINSVGELYQSLYFQNYRVDLAGKAQFYRYFWSTVTFIAAVLIVHSIRIAIIAMILVNIIATWIWDIRKAPEFTDIHFSFCKDSCIKLMRKSLPLCLSLFGSMIVNNSPKYIVNMVSTDSVQGTFSILFMPTYVVNLMCLFIFKPLLAEFSDAIRDESKRFYKLLGKMIGIIAGLSILCSLGMALLGPFMLKLLFGVYLPEYRLHMGLFIFAGGVMALNQFLYYIMVILRKQRQVLAIYVLGVIAAIAAGIPLISRMEIMGALLSFGLSQCVLAISYFYIIIRWGRKHQFVRR